MYEINKAAVIGAGTMGLGIAGQLANAGVDVVLLDIPPTATIATRLPSARLSDCSTRISRDCCTTTS